MTTTGLLVSLLLLLVNVDGAKHAYAFNADLH